MANAFTKALSSLINTSRLSNPAADAVQWTPPCLEFIKINVDASWMPNLRSGFAGVVTRDTEGSFMVACRYMINANNAAMMEAKVILHRYEVGISRGWTFMIIESDLSNSIAGLRNMPTLGSWEAFPILMKCKRLGDTFQACR